MRILVTGATGFLGAHFANAACAGGHEVVAVRRPGAVPRVAVASDVRWLDKPLADVATRDCRGIDAVVHFSSQGVSPQRTTWQEAFRHNVTEQLRLLLAAADANVGRFVLSGSCVEYGPEAAAHEFIAPSTPLSPTGAYAASKAAGCVASLALARDQSLRMVYLRVFHAFGAGQHRDNLWPSLRAAAIAGADYPMTPGEQIRDFVPVGDVASTFLEVCVNRSLEAGRPEVHNVGNGRPVTILEFADRWWRTWDAKGRLLPGTIPYRKDEVMRCVPELTIRRP
jgi:nucleoside-diphosphate-sugar epimerase